MKQFLVGLLCVLAVVFASTGQTQAALPSSVTALIDDSVDPCDDFYQYACGTWIREAEIPSDASSLTFAFDSIQKRNNEVMKTILQDHWPLVSEVWESCMNRSTVNKLGSKPLQHGLNKIQAVDTLDELLELAGEFYLNGTTFAPVVTVLSDKKNVTVHGMYFSPSLPALTYTYYLDSASFAEIESSFREYISTILVLSGYASGEDNSTIEDAVIKVEKQLTNLLVENEAATNKTKPDVDYNPISIGEAIKAYPRSFGQFIKGLDLFKYAPHLTEDSTVIFTTLYYFTNFEKWLDSVDIEDLKTYLAFLFVNHNTDSLSDGFVDASFKFYNRKLNGQEKSTSLADKCTESVRTAFPDLTSKYFSTKQFDADAESDASLTLELIEDAMADRLEEIEWLDTATFEAAETKLENVINFIGYNSQNQTYPFVLSDAELFVNLEKISVNKWSSALGKIGLPATRGEFDVHSDEVNAAYIATSNSIWCNTGILEPPYYNASRHPAHNFGGIGVVFGHELTHGFDSRGRNYDELGNLRDWWTAETSKEFNTRAQCIASQYSNLRATRKDGSIVGNVDGTLTLAESIADNGGLRLAFRAFKTYMNDSSTRRIPVGTDLSEDEGEKLFFLGFAQLHCFVGNDASIQQALLDTHPPGEARVRGAVMNNDDFARVFQCPSGSKMNPVDKCVVW